MRMKILAALAALAATIGSAANAATFTLVDQPNSGQQFSNIAIPTINDNGFVAYAKDAPSAPGAPTEIAMMLWNGQTSTELFRTNNEYFAYSSGVQLNNSNVASFSMFGAGDALVRASTSGAEILNFGSRPPGAIHSFQLTENGDVLFTYSPFSGPWAATIESWGSAAPNVLVAGNGQDHLSLFTSFYSASGKLSYLMLEGPSTTPVRYLGDAASQTAIPNFSGLVHALNDNGELLVQNLGELQIVDQNGAKIIATEFQFGAQFALNNVGQAAYVSNDRNELIVTDGLNTNVFAFSDPLQSGSVQNLQMNDAGVSVFTSAVPITSGLYGTALSFTSGSVMQDILRPGDALGGRIVNSIILGPNALNDKNQVAFRIGFLDGGSAIYIADLFGVNGEVPVPPAIALFLSAIAAGGLARRRAKARLAAA